MSGGAGNVAGAHTGRPNQGPGSGTCWHGAATRPRRCLGFSVLFTHTPGSVPGAVPAPALPQKLCEGLLSLEHTEDLPPESWCKCVLLYEDNDSAPALESCLQGRKAAPRLSSPPSGTRAGSQRPLRGRAPGSPGGERLSGHHTAPALWLGVRAL